MNDIPTNRELRSLFCEQFNCAPADFERRMFWKCLYLHAKVVAPVFSLLLPGLFERDHHFIRNFGNAKDWKDIKSELIALHYEDRFQPRFLRKALRLRICRRKAQQMAARLFRAGNSLQRHTNGSPQSAGHAPHGDRHKNAEKALFDLRPNEQP